MFQLSRRVEYALIAMRHMAAGTKGEIYTSKEISTKYNIPADLLAKVMQSLARKGFITSLQGVHGGYSLTRDPSTVTVSRVIEAIEGKASVKIVQCEATTPDDCQIHGACTIKDPLVKLQGSINLILENLTVTQLI
jgi:Rrf2 family protein